MFGRAYFGARWFGPTYWGSGGGGPPGTPGGYFGHAYFGARYYGSVYFAPVLVIPPGAPGGYFGHTYFGAGYFSGAYFAPPASGPTPPVGTEPYLPPPRVLRMMFEAYLPTEIRRTVFEFGNYLAVGETLSTASVSVAVYSGTDATPSDIKSGSASISGSTVSQLIDATAGVVGVTYALTCTATTSLGQTVSVLGYLTIRPAS